MRRRLENGKISSQATRDMTETSIDSGYIREVLPENGSTMLSWKSYSKFAQMGWDAVGELSRFPHKDPQGRLWQF